MDAYFALGQFKDSEMIAKRILADKDTPIEQREFASQRLAAAIFKNAEYLQEQGDYFAAANEFTRVYKETPNDKKFVESIEYDSNTDLNTPEKMHPHMLRTSKAMHLLDANVNLIYIRDLLGHVNITTTERYAKADSDRKRKALEAAYMEITEDVPNWNEDKGLINWLQELCK